MIYQKVLRKVFWSRSEGFKCQTPQIVQEGKMGVELLLLLSHFSRVRLCATPQTAAHQAPPSLGFSRQEHWSGLPFPSPMHACMLSRFSHVRFYATLRTAAHQAPVHRILQARILEWVAISFSSGSGGRGVQKGNRNKQDRQ